MLSFPKNTPLRLVLVAWGIMVAFSNQALAEDPCNEALEAEFRSWHIPEEVHEAQQQTSTSDRVPYWLRELLQSGQSDSVTPRVSRLRFPLRTLVDRGLNHQIPNALWKVLEKLDQWNQNNQNALYSIEPGTRLQTEQGGLVDVLAVKNTDDPSHRELLLRLSSRLDPQDHRSSPGAWQSSEVAAQSKGSIMYIRLTILNEGFQDQQRVPLTTAYRSQAREDPLTPRGSTSTLALSPQRSLFNHRVRGSGAFIDRIPPWSGDGHLMAFGLFITPRYGHFFDSSFQGIQVFDTLSGKKRYTLEISRLFSLDISQEGHRLAVAHDNGLSLYNSLTGAPILTWIHPNGDTISTAQFSEDGRYIFGSTTKFKHNRSPEILIWSIDGVLLAQIPFENSVFIHSLALSSDHKKMVVHTGTRSVEIWDLQSSSPQLINRLPPPDSSGYNTFALSPDGSMIVTLSGEDQVKPDLWDANTGEHLGVLTTNTNLQNAQWIQFSPDGSSILLGNNNYFSVVSVTPTSRNLELLHLDYINGPRPIFSRDGQRIIRGINSTLEQGQQQLWQLEIIDLYTGLTMAAHAHETSLSQGRTGHIQSLSLSPEGSRVLVSGRMSPSQSNREIERIFVDVQEIPLGPSPQRAFGL